MTTLLAVETSCQQGSVALRVDGRLVEQRSLNTAGRRHAQSLVADLDQLLRDHGLRPAATECLAVSHGPGSFTGLRVGIVFAKTFAWSTGCSVVAVPTLQAVAVQVPPPTTDVVAIADAQRGDVFAASFREPSEHASASVADTEIISLEELKNRVTPQTLVVGPGLQRYREELETVCLLAPDHQCFPQAATIGVIGEHRLSAGQLADPWTLEPFYLRRSAAEEKRDAAQRNAGDP